jgi:hypothetical protein
MASALFDFVSQIATSSSGEREKQGEGHNLMREPFFMANDAVPVIQ